MKKSLIFAAAAAALLTGCAGKGQFLADGDPSGSALTMFKYDGSECRMSVLFSQEQEQQLLNALNSLPAKATAAGELSGDIYAFSIGTGEGDVSGLWQDGVWITPDGARYAVKADIAALTEGLDWEDSSVIPLYALPNIRYLALKDGKWDTACLEKAKEPAKSPLTLTIKDIADGTVQAEIANTTDVEDAYGLAFTLEACIDGEWYGIPPENVMSFISIARIVPAGETVEETYDFSGFYGELPEGLYRLRTEFGSAEFTV